LGRVALFAGDTRRAAALLEESRACFETIRVTFGTAWVFTTLGHVRHAQGTYHEAAYLFRKSLTLAVELDAKQVMAEGLEGVASVVGVLGQAERAARLFGAAHAYCRYPNLLLDRTVHRPNAVWVAEIVRSQMTKTHVFTARTRRNDVADLDIAVGHDDAVDEEFH